MCGLIMTDAVRGLLDGSDCGTYVDSRTMKVVPREKRLKRLLKRYPQLKDYVRPAGGRQTEEPARSQPLAKSKPRRK